MNVLPLDAAAFATRGGAVRPRTARIVHLGLGNFHRAHQAWYTAHADDAAEWGIAAFTGRSPRMAELLRAQDGLYSLVVRGPDGDRVEVVPSIVEVHEASRIDRFIELLASPDVAIVTLTITEAGYDLGDAARLDAQGRASGPDVDELARVFGTGGLADARLDQALSRLALGLEARRRAGAEAIAIVPCDNLPGNGRELSRVLLALAGSVSAQLAAWIASDVSFVDTSVDRITPRIDGDVPAVRAAGWLDAAPVVTEPFSDWVISGAFPAGRPTWESAGARFVDDIEPWEHRKLWLLNGAHTILSCMGLVRGLTTVAGAIADPACRSAVEEFWAEAVRHLPDGIEHRAYRRALLDRFANARIEHRLAQIAEGATGKVRYRLAAVAERSLAHGGDTTGSAGALAAWIGAVRSGVLPADAFAGEIASARADADGVRALVRVVSPRSADHPAFVAEVRGILDPRPAPRADSVPAAALHAATPDNGMPQPADPRRR